MIYIGIDTGKNTGFAVWDSEKKEFIDIQTFQIHEALFYVLRLHQFGKQITVLFEDARKRRWYGERSDAKIQGAGSVKRDAVIWQDFLNDYNIPHRALPPAKGATKIPSDRFKSLTGWKGRTSEHSRDAAMIVWGR